MKKKPTKSSKHSAPILEELEPRLLFSADIEGILVNQDEVDDTQIDFSIIEADIAADSGQLSSTTNNSHALRHEIVFVDADTPDYQQLVDDLLSNGDDNRQFSVFLLDAQENGIEQISHTLSGYQDIDAVHIISHGQEGAVQVGNSSLGFDSLLSNTNNIKDWGNALTEDGDLLIYGCNLAASEDGQALLDSLSRLTGADVSASDDLTGNSELGGNWVLEYQLGQIETSIAFSSGVQQSWSGLLATTTIGDGTAPTDRGGWAGGKQFGVSSFALSTDAGTDTLTGMTVTFAGTDVNDVNASGVKIWRDDGTTANKWDSSDTLIDTGSFSGNTATFTGMSESINTTATQYLVTYDLASGATAGNTLQASVTAATVTNTLVNNDNTDATLTVDAPLVFENDVYKAVYAPGLWNELYLKETSSSGANILQGMSMGSLYSTGPGSLLMGWDPDATATTIVDNDVVTQVQLSGALVDSTGTSYGTMTTTASFYEDRVVLDISMTMTSNPGGTDYMFMTYGTWDDAYLDETFRWTSNDSGSYNTVDPSPNFNSGNQTTPISIQSLFEMGATDGLVNTTLQNISNYDPAQFKYNDPDSGGVDVAFQKVNPGLGTFQSSVIYSFDTTTTGFDTSVTESRQDDSVNPATLNFGIAGGDGAAVGDGFNEQRGAYTLDDNDADDHVQFEFQVTGTHINPVFEITNWDSAAPATIIIDGVTKGIGSDFDAAVDGTTLYIQYLGDISANATFEIGSDTVSGTVYSDEGVTNIGAGKTVRLLVNGVDAGTATTDGSGAYTFKATLSADDTVLVYVDGDDGAADNGTTVTVVDGNSIANLNVYTDHLIARHDNGGALTNADLDTAIGAYVDTEIVYTIDGSDNITGASNTEIYVEAGHIYTPGANITLQGASGNIEINGTLNGGSDTISVSGDWDSSAGTFNYGTSSVNLTGTGTVETAGANYTVYFHNLGLAAAGQLTTMQSHMAAANEINFGSGTVTGAYTLGTFANSGAPVTDAGATKSINAFYYRPTNGTVTVTGGVYDSNLWLWPSGSNATFNLNGDLTVNDWLHVDIDTGNSGIVFNTQNYNITADKLEFGEPGYDGTSTMNFGSSTVDINRLRVGGNGGDHTLNLDSSTINLSGNLVATNGTGTLTINAGTSTVVLDGANDQQILTNGQAFNHLTINNTGVAVSDDIVISGALDIDGNLVITDGDLDIATNDPTVNTAGNVTIGANGSIDVTGRTANWTFDGASIYTDNSSAGPQDLQDVVLNGTSLTLASSAKVETMTVTSGTLDLGNGGYTLEIDGTGTPFTNSGTFDAGDSTVKYTGTGVLTNIATEAYHHLELAPTAATTYQLTGDLAGGNAMTGDLTIGSNATLDATVANNYDLSANNITINGDYLAQASTITAAGNWNHSGGTFTKGTSTVVMTGAGKSINTTGGNQFYNLTIDSGATTTAQTSFGLITNGRLTISGIFNIAAGQTVWNQNDLIINDNATLGGAGQYTQIRRADSVGDTFGTGITISVGTYYYDALFGVDPAPGKTVTGATYDGDVIIRGSGNYGNQYMYLTGGDLIVGGTLHVMDGWSPTTNLIFDNSVENHNITAGNLIVGNNAKQTTYAKFIAGSGAIDINGDVTIDPSDAGGTNELDAGSATWTVTGNWTNNDLFTAGTSTITFDGAAGTQTIDSGGDSFNNVVINNAGATAELADTLTISNDLTVTAGEIDTTVANHALNVNGNVDLDGTITLNGSTITTGGHWDSVGGTFDSGTGTLLMTGANHDLRSDWNEIKNLTIDAGATITAQNTFTMLSGGDLTISGTLDVAANEKLISINPDDFIINVGGELGGAGTFTEIVGSNSSVHTFDGTISVATYNFNVLNNAQVAPGHILTGATYGGDLKITSSGNQTLNYVHISGGDLNVGGDLIVATDLGWHGPINTILDNSQENRNITANGLIVGNAGAADEYAQFIAGSGNIDINGNVTIYASDASGTNSIDAGSATWNVSGGWANNDSFNAGTSTIILDGTDQAINGSNTFNNLSKTDSVDDGTDLTLTFDNTATQIINGTLTLDGLGNDDRINLVSDNPGNQWSLVLGAAATPVIDYVDVTDSDASGSDVSHITIDPANSIDSGNNVDWFNAAPTAANNTVSMNEDASYTFTAADFNFADTDVTDNLVQIQITSLETAGSLKLSGVDVTLNQVISVADINAGNLVFTPIGDDNGVGYDSFQFKVHDGVDYSAASYSMTMDVTSVNDAPAGTNNTVTTLEGNAYTFAAGDFGFSDVLDGDSLLVVKITTLPGAGTLTNNGVAVNAGDTISAGDIAANRLAFTPVADANGAGYASFTFQVQDDGGTANGGVDLDATPNTMMVDVTSVNDAPAGTDNTVSTLENNAYTFAAGDFGFSDVLDGDSLLGVKITTLPGVGTLTNNGVAVNAGDTISAADIAANRLVFTPVANANGAGYANFTFQVQDDGGTANGGVDLDATPNTINIDVTTVNNAPSGTDNTITTLEDSPYTFSAGDFGFTDPLDGDNLLGVKITTLPGAGILTNNGVAVNAGDTISAADITANRLVFTPAADANGSGYASFTFQVQDDAGTANGGVDLDATPNTLTIDVTAVNDAPAAVDDTLTTNEDTTLTITTASDLLANDSDVDGDTLTITGFIQAANGVVTDNGDGTWSYTPNQHFFGIDTLSYSIADGNGGVDSATLTLNVTSVNDLPTAGNDALSVEGGTILTIDIATDLLANDSDVESASLSLVAVNPPANGSLIDNGDGTYSYTPNTGFVGDDVFSYSVADGNGGTVQASVTISVTLAPTEDDSDTEVVVETAPTPTDIDPDPVVEHVPEPEAPLLSVEEVDDSAHGNSGSASQTQSIEQTSNTNQEQTNTAPEAENPTQQQTESAPQNTTEQAQSSVDANGKPINPQANQGIAANLQTPGITTHAAVNGMTTFSNGAFQFAPGLSNQPLTTLAAGSLYAVESGDESGEYTLKYVVNEPLAKSLDAMSETLTDMDDVLTNEEKLALGVSTGVSISFTTGVVSWALRGGALASSFLANVPLWHGFDPLPVLSVAGKKMKQAAAQDANQIKEIFGGAQD